AAEHKYLKEKLQGYRGDPKQRALRVKTIRQPELSIDIGGVYQITLGSVTVYAQAEILAFEPPKEIRKNIPYYLRGYDEDGALSNLK
ncbi:unnamed protein product, partial [Allacma fusca]